MQSNNLSANLQLDKFWHDKWNSVCFYTDNLLESVEKVRRIFVLTTININIILTQLFLLYIYFKWVLLSLDSTGFDSSTIPFLYQVKSKWKNLNYSRLDITLKKLILRKKSPKEKKHLIKKKI